MRPAWVRVLRLDDSMHYALVTIAGVLYASLIGSPLTFIQAIEIFAIMSIFSVFSFISNNFFDREVDKNNPNKRTKNPYAHGEISTRVMILLNGLLLFGALSLTWLFFPLLLSVLVIAAVNILLYTRIFKHIPILDLVSHCIWVSGFILIPLWAAGVSSIVGIGTAIGLFGASNLVELDNQFKDRKEDAKAGIRTTAVAFPKGAMILSWVSSVLAAGLIVWLAQFNIVALVVLPLVFLHRVQYIRPFPQFDRVYFWASVLTIALLGVGALW